MEYQIVKLKYSLFYVIRWLLSAALLALAPVVSADGGQDKVVFLIVEPNRLVASNALRGRFDELKLSAKETIVEYVQAEAVIVVITNQRYIAYGAYAPGWMSLKIRANEILNSVQAKDASAALVTSDRYLNFSGRRGQWAESKRRL